MLIRGFIQVHFYNVKSIKVLHIYKSLVLGIMMKILSKPKYRSHLFTQRQSFVRDY
jgi:hypothetical protein